jgi:hypothetical protein
MVRAELNIIPKDFEFSVCGSCVSGDDSFVYVRGLAASDGDNSFRVMRGGEKVKFPKLVTVRIGCRSDSSDELGEICFIDSDMGEVLNVGGRERSFDKSFHVTANLKSERFQDIWKLSEVLHRGEVTIGCSIEARDEVENSFVGRDAVWDLADSKDKYLSPRLRLTDFWFKVKLEASVVKA